MNSCHFAVYSLLASYVKINIKSMVSEGPILELTYALIHGLTICNY